MLPATLVSTADEDVDEVSKLIVEYNSSADEARRIEIVYELCLGGGPAAQRTLAAIYRTTPNWRTKIELLRALPSVPSEDLGPLVAVVDEALESKEPMIRDAALDVLHGFTHPQMAPLWRRLLTDPNPDLRAEAETMLETLNDDPANALDGPAPSRRAEAR